MDDIYRIEFVRNPTAPSRMTTVTASTKRDFDDFKFSKLKLFNETEELVDPVSRIFSEISDLLGYKRTRNRRYCPQSRSFSSLQQTTYSNSKFFS